MTTHQGLPRTLELVVASTGLVLLSPLLLAVALVVRMTSPGPVLFRQVRVGCEGRSFTLFKFRTMIQGADHGRPLTVGQDPRVTRPGRWLRAHKLDELPQLFNVVRGDMSLVGPRPEVPEYVRPDHPLQAEVLRCRPGLTDPASLAFVDEAALLAHASDPDAAYLEVVLPTKLGLSAEYLRGRSARTDLVVLLTTAAHVLRPGRQAARSAAVETAVLTTAEELTDAWPRLEELQVRTGCPITARSAWQQTWLHCRADAQPHVVLVERRGELVAAAPLAVLTGRGVAHVVPLGGDRSDDVQLPALDREAARALAVAVHASLDTLGRWWLDLPRLSPDDEVLAALRDELPHPAVLTAEASPMTALGNDRRIRTYVTRNHHQAVRRLRNRLGRESREWTVRIVTDETEVAALLPEMERVMRARDRAVGRACELDDPVSRHFLREVTCVLAARDEVRLVALDVDGRLGAWVLCLRDGRAWRMWSCRFDPALERYGVGRLALDAALGAALEEPACTTFDWLRGEEGYKAQLSSSVRPSVDLVAARSVPSALIRVVPRVLRCRLRMLRDRSPGLRRTWAAVRRS